MYSNDLLPHIEQLAKQNSDIDTIWLHGSRAQGLARQDNDYDLAVAFNDFSLDVLARYVHPHSLALDWASALHLPEQ
jgi:predicted nucleotidyltransferase